MRARPSVLAALVVVCLLLLVPTLSSASPNAPLLKAAWLDDVLITSYYPVPERWFQGKRVAAPGLTGLHRVDWLYSGRGISMQGDGIGLDGGRYHIRRTGTQGWVDENGRATAAGGGGWTRGFPFWRGVGWRNKKGQVTFPLERGGWFNGKPKRYIKPEGIDFGVGPSRPLDYWRSVAVDPGVIPLGSLVFVPKLCNRPSRGWTVAEDIGGAVIGRHIDVYRPAPASLTGRTDYHEDARVFVLPPNAKPPKRWPRCANAPLLPP